MRTFLLILTICFCLNVQGQGVPFDKYTTDTIKLKDFTVKKIVSYKINSVTVYVNYEDYIKEHYVFWKRYHDGMKETAKEKRKGENINSDYELRYKVIDSIYKLLRKEVKTSDTIYLTQETFDNVGLRCLMDLDKQIDKGTCAIVDDKNNRQYIIIRQKGSVYRGPLNAWGGRRYFLLGQPNYFFEATDWIS